MLQNKPAESIGRAFQNALEQGGTPRIEEFVVKLPASGQEQVVTELLKLEIDCRRKRGEQPDRDAYAQRFPEHSEVLDAVFSAGDAQGTLGTSLDCAAVDPHLCWRG